MEKVDRRGRPRVQTQFLDESLTVQSDAHGADIKQILGKYAVGQIPTQMDHVSKFVDLSELTDYADAMRVVKEVESAFLGLPASARKVFKNDHARWLDAVQDADVDPEKFQLLVDAGLVQAPEVPAAPVEPVVSAEPAAE